MRVSIEERINRAADRLMRAPLSAEQERRHDDAYIRATKALDPDTRYALADAGDDARAERTA